MKFGTRVRLKPSNDRGEFKLDRARSENNIAKNLFALGHETHNRSVLFAIVVYRAEFIRCVTYRTFVKRISANSQIFFYYLTLL